MLSVMIVDDEPVAVRRMAALLRDLGEISVVATAGNSQQALEMASRHTPDLALLDIELPGLDGMALAGRLRALERPPAIVFVTAFGRFALEAFDLAASDYLVKPVEPARLAEAVARVRSRRDDRAMAGRVDELEGLVERLRAHGRVGRTDAALWLPGLQSAHRVPISEVLWMEAEKDYVRVHVPERSYFVRGRIGEFAERLAGQGMMRIHRSALVRIGAVVRIHHLGDRSYRLEFANGTSVAASRRFAASVSLALRRLDALSEEAGADIHALLGDRGDARI